MEQEIIGCEEKLLQAFKDANIQVIDELIHDKLIFNGPAGQIVNKQMDMEGYKTRIMKVDIIESKGREINILDDVAVVSTLIYMKGSFMDNPIDGNTRFLRIWKKFGEGWKVIAGSSVIPN